MPNRNGEGPRGERGFDGQRGIDGQRGYDGTQGEQGIDGPAGPEGKVGVTGHIDIPTSLWLKLTSLPIAVSVIVTMLLVLWTQSDFSAQNKADTLSLLSISRNADLTACDNRLSFVQYVNGREAIQKRNYVEDAQYLESAAKLRLADARGKHDKFHRNERKTANRWINVYAVHKRAVADSLHLQPVPDCSKYQAPKKK